MGKPYQKKKTFFHYWLTGLLPATTAVLLPGGLLQIQHFETVITTFGPMETTASDSVCQESVYRELFQLHARRVRNYLYYKGASAEEAEDLMQEAFLRLWRECERVPQQKAAAFLFTVAGNLFLDARKHDQVVLRFQRQVARQAPGVASPSENPHARLEYSETLTRIEAALAALPEGQRTVFLMNRMDGMTYNEIAQALELSVKAIEKRMSLALKSLRSALKNQE